MSGLASFRRLCSPSASTLLSYLILDALLKWMLFSTANRASECRSARLQNKCSVARVITFRRGCMWRKGVLMWLAPRKPCFRLKRHTICNLQGPTSYRLKRNDRNTGGGDFFQAARSALSYDNIKYEYEFQACYELIVVNLADENSDLWCFLTRLIRVCVLCNMVANIHLTCLLYPAYTRMSVSLYVGWLISVWTDFHSSWILNDN